jgi:hypothetical protein
MQEDQGYACIEYGYPRHSPETPHKPKVPRGGSGGTDSQARKRCLCVG